ncbi:hypothetical protein HNR01_001785 [Methylorubrum rhodesianum]|uniref:hypothetical protein n=1 Tax=Methylorubrum rhodesianum TaxID=29427 RepID=UPI00160A8D35|nr:hypothetical protein [Methylorubrum rhodesianum]MBB5762165.1 hypothetical protein [Methylorubrum rhodesianum]
MKRSALAITVAMVLAASAAEARTIFPELMSRFDIAHAACQSGPERAPETRRACRERDTYWRKLRDAGYTLHRDPTNPNGYVWQ